MLQKSVTAPRSADEMEVSDSASPSTPKESTDSSAPAIDPALSSDSPASTCDNSESARDRAQEIWVENIRVIEALRKFISDRLENHQYEEDSDDQDVEMAERQAKEKSPAAVKPETGAEHENLYPVLRAAIDSAT
jgi:hypothetical protein